MDVLDPAKRNRCCNTSPYTMINIWIIAAGAAVTAAALVMRRRRTAGTRSPKSSIEPVSTEWLSHARGWRDESW